jgi:hypothetical protein
VVFVFILCSALAVSLPAKADQIGPEDNSGQDQVNSLSDDLYACYRGNHGPGHPTEEQCGDLAEQAAALVKVCDRNTDFRDGNYQLCDNAHNLYRVVLEQRLNLNSQDGGLRERVRSIVSGAEEEARAFLPSFMRGCDFSVGRVGAKTPPEARLHGMRAAPRGTGATCTIHW